MSTPSLTSKGVSIAITLVTLASCAFLLARGSTSYAASKLAPLDGVSSAHAPGSARQLPGSETPDMLAILRRNVFDWATGPLPKPIEPPPIIYTKKAPAPLDPRKLPPACDASVKLIASVYSERSREQSFGSVGDGSSAPLLYREGSKLGDLVVARIFPNALYLRKSDGALCSLTMFGAGSERAGEEPGTLEITETDPTTVAAPRTSAEAELDAAITKVSDAQYTVKRAFVDKLLADPSQLMSVARIIPHEENGQPLGMKLYGIRRNSLLGKLGLQNGDTLRAINGMSMADPGSALDAYAKLRGASELKVAITRRGQDTSLGLGITE